MIDIAKILQDAYDSKVCFSIQAASDTGYLIEITPPLNDPCHQEEDPEDWIAQLTAPTLVEAITCLGDLIKKQYPESQFATKYATGYPEQSTIDPENLRDPEIGFVIDPNDYNANLRVTARLLKEGISLDVWDDVGSCTEGTFKKYIEME